MNESATEGVDQHGVLGVNIGNNAVDEYNLRKKIKYLGVVQNISGKCFSSVLKIQWGEYTFG